MGILRTGTAQLLLQQFGKEEPAEGKTKKRGAPLEGGGGVYLRVPVVKSLLPINLVDEGLVKRIRGIAYTTKTSPLLANRLVDGARVVLSCNVLPDVHICTNHFKGKDSGLSPGYGLTLVVESTTDVLLSAELVAR